MLYQDKNYRAEAHYFLSLITKYGRSNSRTLLEYGVGTGGHQAFFEEAGFACSGIELSDEMCKIGKARGVLVLQADMRNYRHSHRVDAVVALFHVISYLTTEQDIVQTLSRARDNLHPDGVFIFDVWFEDAVLSQSPETRVKRASDGTTEVVRIAEPTIDEDKKLVSVTYTMFGRGASTSCWQSFSELHTLRYFSLADIKWLADSAGLDLLGIEETMSGAAPSKNSWGITIILGA